MRRDQRPRIVFAELVLETLIGLLVQGERLLEFTERVQVGAQPVRGDERVRVIGPEHRTLPFQHVGVQFARVTEPALRPQHVGDVELQVQGLRVVGAELVGPQGLQAAGQAQSRTRTRRASTGSAPSR